MLMGNSFGRSGAAQSNVFIRNDRDHTPNKCSQSHGIYSLLFIKAAVQDMYPKSNICYRYTDHQCYRQHYGPSSL